MKLIVGLGNPGRSYENTRHNIGFHVIDQLAERFHSPLTQSKFKGLFTIIHKHDKKFILLKPLTFMNLSGECIRPLMDYYKIESDHLLVIYDDLDLPVGRIRLRTKGSAGGHNGMRSIIAHLGTEQFNRIRIGINRPPTGMSVPQYVLSSFSQEEKEKMQRVVQTAARASEDWLDQSFLEVMNQYNVKK